MQTITVKELKSISKKTHSYLVKTGKNLPIMVWGPMGVGKSAGVKQSAAELGIKCIDVRLTLLNPVDLRGLPTVNREKGIAEWLTAGFLPDVKRDGEEGILFLDEINIAPASVMAAGYQLILDRRIGDYVLPPKWSVMAAGNRTEDSNNITKMPNPLLNRFIHYHIERPEFKEWMSWAVKNGISEKIIGFLNKFPQHLLQAPKNAEKAFPSPRSWEFASSLVDMGEPVDAAVGGGVAGEFRAYTEVFDRIPDINAILKGEEDIRLPSAKELDVWWATSMALIVAAEPKHWSNVFKYMLQAPIEFTTIVIKSLSDKSDEFFNAIAHSKEFPEFRKKHPALFERDSDD